jgi:hypothetical protein
MPKPNEKLADSLAALKELQKGGRRVFRSKELAEFVASACSATALSGR